MPLLKLETNVAVSELKREELLKSLSQAVAQIVGKPEQYVMVSWGKVDIVMSGTQGAAAFVEVRSIGGLSATVNRKLSQRVSKIVMESLGLSIDRIYLNFTEIEASHWGWNGDTFA